MSQYISSEYPFILITLLLLTFTLSFLFSTYITKFLCLFYQPCLSASHQCSIMCKHQTIRVPLPVMLCFLAPFIPSSSLTLVIPFINTLINHWDITYLRTNHSWAHILLHRLYFLQASFYYHLTSFHSHYSYLTHTTWYFYQLYQTPFPFRMWHRYFPL